MKRKLYFLTVALFFFSAPLFGQEWLVPDGEKDVKSALEYNLSNVQKGMDLYLQNCKSCHGDPGKNNALPLVPPPPDISSEIMQKNTEGEMFYKISTGRGGMPSFASVLSEDERWRIVNYILNFDPERDPVLVVAEPAKAKLLASVNEKKKKVEVFAEAEKDGVLSDLQNTPITISAKKYFGNIEIGKVNTDENGRAEFTIPETLIGDEEGYVNIVVALDESFAADEVTLDEAKVGQNKVVPQLIRKEVLWSTNENVQTWLLLTYLSTVALAWGTIGYVVFQIIKIKRLSRN